MPPIPAKMPAQAKPAAVVLPPLGKPPRCGRQRPHMRKEYPDWAAGIPNWRQAVGHQEPVAGGVPVVAQHPKPPAPVGCVPRVVRPAPWRQLVGHYEVFRCLGQGGFGQVFEVRDRREGRRLAVKQIDLAAVGFKFAVAEARLLAHLRHPNVVRYFGCEQHYRWLWLRMELVDGVSLSQLLRRRGALDESAVKNIMRQLFGAVSYCHGRGIVHRDLKPSNVMLRADGAVKLVDFGVGRSVGSDGLAKTVCGTPGYMAPELAAVGSRYMGQAVDAWGLGLLLYELLTGNRPASLTRRQMMCDLKQRVRDDRCSNNVFDLVDRLLDLKPATRMSSQAALQHAWFSSAAPNGE